MTLEQHPPQVIGLEAGEARELLQAAKVTVVEMVETAPPRGRRPEGPARVIRQRQEERGVSLLVAATVPAPQEGDSHD